METLSQTLLNFCSLTYVILLILNFICVAWVASGRYFLSAQTDSIVPTLARETFRLEVSASAKQYSYVLRVGLRAVKLLAFL